MSENLKTYGVSLHEGRLGELPAPERDPGDLAVVLDRGNSVRVGTSEGWVGLASYATDANGNVTGLVDPVSGGVIALRKQSSIAGLKLLANVGVGTKTGDAVNGVIFNAQLPALGSFYGVKIKYQNYDTVNPLTIDGAKVAPSPIHKTNGNNTLTWSSFITFSGSQSVVIPVAVTGAGGQVVPSEVISDFIQVTSIARTDAVGEPPLLRIATHIAPSANSTSHASYNGTNYLNFNNLAVNPKLKNATYVFNGTLATLASNGNSCDDAGGVQCPVGAIFYYSTAKQEIAAFGDSLVQGVGSTTGMTGWPDYVTFNSFTQGLQFTCYNDGRSAQNTVDTLATIKESLSIYKPKYCAFKAWSPNDGNTQAIFDASWGYTLEAINYCFDNGVIPIVLTSAPASGYNWTLIKAQNARVINLPKGVVVVDTATLLNNPASDGTILPAYDSDGTHYNDAGYSAIANLIIASIKS